MDGASVRGMRAVSSLISKWIKAYDQRLIVRLAVFAMAMAIYFYNRAWGIGLMAAGVIIGAARVAGGVHYPSDIIGGVIVGLLTGLLVHYVIEPRAESFTAKISRISDRLLPFTRRG